MNIGRWRLLLVIAVLSLFLFAGCSSETAPGEDPVDGTPAVGGDMVFGMTSEPVILNPILSTGTPASFVNNRVFASLVRADENLQMEPYVAEDWEFSDDGLQWTFNLRDDVYFHDGEQLTADDVVYTYMAMLHEDYTGVRATTYEPIEEVLAVDDLTVQFILKRPHAPLLTDLTMGIMPSHLLADKPIAQLRELDFNMEPVGAGPFVFEQWRSGEHIVLDRNPDFFLEGPFIEQVRVRFYGDEQVMLTALEAGDIDYMGSVPPDDIERVMQEYSDRLQFHERQNNGYSYIGLKQNHPILEDKLVRQAMAYGINRRTVVDDVLNGYGTVMNANTPPFSWAYNPNLTDYGFDQDRAVELLHEAGWTEIGDDGIRRNADGDRLTVECVTSTGNVIRENTLLIAQQNLAEIGFDFDVQFYEWTVLLEQYLDVAMFESYMLGWSLGLDPDAYLFFHSEAGLDDNGNLKGFNDVEYSNERVDELLEMGRTTLQQEERLEIYHEIQEILNDELPYIFLYSQDLVSAVSTDIRGMTMSDIGPLYMEQWYIQTADADE